MPKQNDTSPRTPEALIEKALAALPAKSPKGLTDLLKIMADQIQPEDLGLFSGDILASITQTHWDLAKEKKSGNPEIRIYSSHAKDERFHRTVIDIVSNDMAFLVDSAIAEVNRHNILIDHLLHPILFAEYDKSGTLTGISLKDTPGSVKQSHISIQIKDLLPEDILKTLKEGMLIALHDVHYANRDWPVMNTKMAAAIEDLASATTKHPAKEIDKYCAFLEYLKDNNFTFLAYREYKFEEKDGDLQSKIVKGKSLGLLADDFKPAYISESEEGLPRNLQELRRKLAPVSISKTNRLSTVHRRVPMDAIAVKTYDSNGEVTGEKLFLGLLTSVTYARSVSSIPYLREKVEAVINDSNFLEGSHDRKALRHILERYPRDELFQMEEGDLFKTAVSILRLQEKQRVALFLRKDPFGRYISCLIYIPRDRFSSELRETMVDILERELLGKCGNFYSNMDDSVFARVTVTIHISQKNPPKFKTDTIESMLVDAARTWPERLSTALYETERGSEENKALTAQYATAFPVSYTSRYTGKQAVFDIEKIETAIKTNALQLELYRPEDVSSGQLRLKLYNPGAPVTLSDVMPILENIGLRTISELPFEITPASGCASVWIHDFLVEVPEIKEVVNIADVKPSFERAFSKIWAHEAEDDGLNRLLLSANLNWHEITILRAYVRYLKQIGSPFSRPYIQKALTSFPQISSMIVAMFKALHDPKNGENAESLAAKCALTIDKALESVESLDQDRILRSMTNLVESTLRTNYYQRNSDGSAKSYLAFKIDSRTVSDMPDPKPLVEIFVYSTKVEGVHLRGDRIARGGIRWSDRHEDFRTEVLGLMKAQMVKNAVIVPTGAKGGFVVKTPTNTREEFMKEGIECYKTFIRALLDITDNRKGGKRVPPKDVVCRDGDDPYLVVAADKGTATFSDIANGISQEYGHWLDDAFASGGSAGYDHKKMAITARGAWESVKAHFRALGHNIQTNAFDVVGVGDMGGDVFGNGMLLSPYIKLVGAFNHLHIFCDPNPDEAVSFKERKRLFDAVKGWDTYDVNTLSKGGRIYNRSEKLLELTPEIKARFDIDKDKVAPNDLMKAMLKSRTDLLWFGGIGTYIKSTKQSHADVGDKANDSLRIDATEIRARVIGEGANLALTQLGRIEFAERGGRLNTDFVDNSGGVNSSDLEVNIKILMTDIMRDKSIGMDLAARNKLLESMTEDVSGLVLRNNYQQAQAISLAEIQAREQLPIQEEFISELERTIGLNRRIEGLPDSETVQARIRAGKGLTRPELCILLSYAKIGFTKALLKSDIPDSPGMEEWVVNYFPSALRQKYRPFMLDHQLKREIIATSMSNSLINRMGPTFLKSRMAKTGASMADIARAYIVVREAFGLRSLWDQIEALDNKVPALVQLKAMKDISNLASHAVTWFLTRLGRPLEIASDTAAFGKGVEQLRGKLLNLLSPEMLETAQQHAAMLERDGLPKALAEQIALLPTLASACDIIKVSLEQKTDLHETAKIYFDIGERFQMGWLRQQARFLPADDHWQAEAVGGLVDQLYSSQAGMTVRILHDTNSKPAKGKTLFDTWMADQGRNAEQIDPLLADLRRSGTLDLPMLVIAEQRLRQLYGG